MSARRVVPVVISVLIAALSAFMFLLSFTFGSGGFGGSLVRRHEGLAQSSLGLAALLPVAVAVIPLRLATATLAVQVAFVVVGAHLLG